MQPPHPNDPNHKMLIYLQELQRLHGRLLAIKLEMHKLKPRQISFEEFKVCSDKTYHLEKAKKEVIKGIMRLQVEIAALQATLPAPEPVGSELLHIYSKLDEDFTEKTAEVMPETKRSHPAMVSPTKPGDPIGMARFGGGGSIPEYSGYQIDMGRMSNLLKIQAIAGQRRGAGTRIPTNRHCRNEGDSMKLTG